MTVHVIPSDWIEGEGRDFVLDEKSDIVDGPFGSNLKASEYIDEGVPIARIQNVKRLKFIDKNIRYVSEEKALDLDRHTFLAGDILVTKLGDPLGLACVAPQSIAKGVIVADLVRIRPNLSVVDTDYVVHLLNSETVIKQIAGHVKGTTRPRINLSVIRNLRLPLAPLAEQRVIAAKLNELLAQVDTIKTRLNAIPAILRRFRQSVLSAAVSGRLTEDRRGSQSIALNQSPVTIGSESNEAPKGWEWNKLIQLAKLESGHTPRKTIPGYWDNGDVYWISLQDIRAAHGTVILDTKNKPTMLGIENSSARLLPKGTVCFSRDISVGYTTIMGHEMSTTQHFANWICGDELNNKFLMYSLMAAKEHLTISGQGTTVKTIYMPALKQFRLLTPPLEEQTEIVDRVEQLLTYANQIEQRVIDAQSRVNNLTQSILARAFRGELTADWREQHPELISGEHSAETLLEKIKAERIEAAKQKKPVRRTMTKKSNTIMKAKQIIPVVDALKSARKSLTSQQLLTEAGYPTDASVDQLENFFLDIREQVNLGVVTRERRGDDELLSLVD